MDCFLFFGGFFYSKLQHYDLSMMWTSEVEQPSLSDADLVVLGSPQWGVAINASVWF